MTKAARPPGPPPIPVPVEPTRTLEKGSIVLNRFEILEKLGASELATAYLARDKEDAGGSNVSFKLLEPPLTELFEEFEPVMERASQCEHRSLSRIVDWGMLDDQPYIALEYLSGRTLKDAIEGKQEASARFMPRTALSLIAPICQALNATHSTGVAHGALTPQNVYVERYGRVRLANLGFGWLIQRALDPSGMGATADSAFIAPEVRANPNNVTILSDIYSLGMLAICLLAGHHPSKDAADDVAKELLKDVPERLRELLSCAIDDDPGERPVSAKSFLDALSDGIEDLRDQIIAEAIETGMLEIVRDPTGSVGAFTTGGLSAILGAEELPEAPESGDDPTVWLIHQDGFDYGPFTSEQVRDQLLQDAVDENTEIRNLETRESGLLSDMREFEDIVADYIPVRDERRRREEERRAEVQRKVKRAGTTGIITVIIGLLGLIGLYVYYAEFIRAKPEPIVVESLFARVGRDFRAPEQSYVGISADPDLIAALFNFEEEIEERPTRRRRRRSNSGETPTGPDASALGQEQGTDGSTLDFTQAAGNRRLTSSDINDTILEDGRAIQRCLRSEVSRNSSFSGTEMRFVVRPDGRTQGVDLGSGNYTEELRSCLTPIFRQMRFPQHDGLNLPVSFPFHVR